MGLEIENIAFGDEVGEMLFELRFAALKAMASSKISGDVDQIVKNMLESMLRGANIMKDETAVKKFNNALTRLNHVD